MNQRVACRMKTNKKQKSKIKNQNDSLKVKDIHFLILICIFAFLFLIFNPFMHYFNSAISYALNETHLDSSKLPQGCGSCHKSHGKRATVMLKRTKEDLCMQCHGIVKKGVQGESRTDIYSDILKHSNHPIIQTTRYHFVGEDLPEKSPAIPRHVSCFDCHNPHLLTKDKPLAGVNGYSGRGAQVKNAQYEYQVCYKCHSDSANLPSGASNIANDFDPSNVSFHPIEAVGKNKSVPSIERGLSILSIITCSDCHGNDNKEGAKGPHGSNYEFILKGNYTRDSSIESHYAYELCYSCHIRNSILNDESFNAHKRHVLHGRVSCYACHDAHGSRDYENLINFDTRVVSPNSIGELTYIKSTQGRPRCFLNCHIDGITYEHKITNSQYCVNTNCPPGW